MFSPFYTPAAALFMPVLFLYEYPMIQSEIAKPPQKNIYIIFIVPQEKIANNAEFFFSSRDLTGFFGKTRRFQRYYI